MVLTSRLIFICRIFGQAPIFGATSIYLRDSVRKRLSELYSEASKTSLYKKIRTFFRNREILEAEAERAQQKNNNQEKARH